MDPSRLLAAHAAATEFYRAQLPGHPPAVAYLHSRAVAAAVAALFHPVAYHFYLYYFAALAVAAAAVYEVEAPAAGRLS